MKRRFHLAAYACAALAVWLAWLNSRPSPLLEPPLQRASPEPAGDEHLGLASSYAPWIWHEVHPEKGRQDIPAAVDFDGNLDGRDNWETFPRFELVPTVYYAVVESGTHWFLTYHVFHPRDWEVFDLGLQLTHEGDGENLQVVVDKTSGEVVLLFAQAHYRGRAYANPSSRAFDGEQRLRAPLLLIGDDGRVDPSGPHAAVFVESRGHGIYGALDPSADLRIGADGQPHFRRRGIVLRPAAPSEEVGEPLLDAAAPVAYRLESTLAKLWPLRESEELFDGWWPYERGGVALELPRFHRGDRFSGPLGSSRGISPFAVDFRWCKGSLGALLLDPAGRWAEVLGVPEPWSLEYAENPFARSATNPGSPRH
ncbi:MAG TPA: hypothetical protein VMS76_03880 [Planctomycetota bacterium]|nr:hypothetical protein [Planctomycetota bacterium]